MKQRTLKRAWRMGLHLLATIALVFQGLLPLPLPADAAVSVYTRQSEDQMNTTAETASIYVGVSEAAIYKIEYGTTSSYGITVSSYINSTPWNLRHNLSPLSPLTTYHYRVGACPMKTQTECYQNPGLYQFSPDMTITTLERKDSSAPLAFSLTDPSTWTTTANSVTLSWYAPSDTNLTGSNQLADHYEVKYKASWMSESDWLSATTAATSLKPSVSTPGGTETYTVSGLASGMYYCFSIKAYDAAGNVSPMATNCKTTEMPKDITPPSQITGVTVTDTTTNSVTVKWIAPSDTMMSGTVGSAMKYKFAYSTLYLNGDAEWGASSFVPSLYPKMPGQEEVYTFTGLLANTKYYFSLQSLDSAGNMSPFSTPIFGETKTTSTIPPDTGTSPSITSVYHSGVSMTGASLYFYLSESAMVRAEYSKDQTTWSSTPESWFTSGTSNSIPLTGLMSDTNYSYRLIATKSPTLKSSSGTYSFRTMPSYQPVENKLPPGTASIDIIITDPTGVPVQGAQVGLSSCTSNSSMGCSASGPTSASGLLHFSGILGGSYNIGAGGYMAMNRADLGYITKCPVTLVEGQKITKTIKLPYRSTQGTATEWSCDQDGGVVQPPVEQPPIISNVTTEPYPNDHSTMMLRWTSNTPTMLKMLEYGPTITYGMYRPMAGEMMAQVFSYSGSIKLSALTSKTTYYFKIIARDEKGRDGYYNGSFITSSVIEPPPVQLGKIYGSVKSEQGVGLANAEVQLFSSSGKKSAWTSSDGAYSFDVAQQYSYTIEIAPPMGYPRPEPRSFFLSGAEMRQDFTLSKPSMWLTGKVSFTDGLPVNDAQIIARRTDSSFYQCMSAWTDSFGKYSLSIQPGKWRLMLRQPSMYGGECMGSGGGSNWPMPYPPTQETTNVSTGQGMTTMNTAMGPSAMMPMMPSWEWREPPKEVEITDSFAAIPPINFTVTRYVLQTEVRGRLVMQGGGELPADSGIIAKLTASDGTAQKILIPRTGNFTFSSPGGSYTLSFFFEKQESRYELPQGQSFTVFQGMKHDTGTFFLRPVKKELFITGRVTTEGGEGVGGVKLLAIPSGGCYYTSGMSGGGCGALHPNMPYQTFTTETTSDGMYSFPVSSGNWRVEIVKNTEGDEEKYFPLKRFEEVMVREESREGVNFTVVLADAIIKGSILDNETNQIATDVVAGVSITTPRGQWVRNVKATKGYFSTRLPRGNYVVRLYIAEGSDYIAPQEPKTANLEKGGEEALSFLLRKKEGILFGSLIDSENDIVRNVMFSVSVGREKQIFNGFVDQKFGSYRIALPPGTWKLNYSIDDPSSPYSVSPDPIIVTMERGGSKIQRDLKVIRNVGTIKGSTRDASGNPVPGVLIGISTRSFTKFSRESARSLSYLDYITSEADGSFEKKVAPGKLYYVASFIKPGSGFINPQESTVSVKSADVPATVDLVFRSTQQVIKGRVTRNGEPTWAFVWAWSNKGGYAQDFAEEDSGEYELTVAPNDIWHVSASTEVDRVLYKANEAALTVGREPTTTFNLALASLNVTLPSPVTIQGASADLLIAENDFGAQAILSAHAVDTSGQVTLSMKPDAYIPSQVKASVVGGYAYDINVFDSTGNSVTKFDEPLQVSIPIDKKALAKIGGSTDRLTLQYYDEQNSLWRRIDNAFIDEKTGFITGSVDHATKFAIIAETEGITPTAPASLGARLQKNGILLSWKKPKDSKLSFKIYRSTTKGELGEPVLENLSSSSAKDSGMERGKTYYYTIHSVSAAGTESTNTNQAKISVKGKGALGVMLKKETKAEEVTAEEKAFELPKNAVLIKDLKELQALSRSKKFLIIKNPKTGKMYKIPKK